MLPNFDLLTRFIKKKSGPLLLHLFHLNACRTFLGILTRFSHVLRYLKPNCCPWGSLGTSRNQQNVRSSILEKVRTKHGVVCLRIVPYLKEEGELLNGSHGKK